jgi:hypothetical protein
MTRVQELISTVLTVIHAKKLTTNKYDRCSDVWIFFDGAKHCLLFLKLYTFISSVKVDIFEFLYSTRNESLRLQRTLL